jgi:hypothetical protein
LIQNKKHSFIPKYVWMNGIITNPIPSFEHLLKWYTIANDNTWNFLVNLWTQADLIVVLNENINLTALKESLLH